MGTSCTAKPTTLRENQFPQLRECTELSGTSEVEGENKEERDRQRERQRERERKEGRRKDRKGGEKAGQRERARLKIANRDKQIFLLSAPAQLRHKMKTS